MGTKIKNKKNLFVIIVTLITFLIIAFFHTQYVCASNTGKEKDDLIVKNREKFHFVYFMHNDCPACKFFSPIIRKFTDQYNIRIFSYDLGNSKGTDLEQIDNQNLLNEVNPYYLPTLVAVNNKTGHWVKISETILTFAELERALVDFLQTKFERDTRSF
jgi:hypothetical protein